MEVALSFWVWFNVAVIACVMLDLGIFDRKDKEMSMKQAGFMVTLWVSLAIAFYFWMGKEFGSQAALEFLTGYVIELSLSADNVFVFALIFAYFNVPKKYQHRVLFWGIIGALIMRGAMIGLGAALIAKYHWIIYIFGGFLIVTGLKFMFEKESNKDLGQNPILKLAKRLIPITPDFHGKKFFTKINGKIFATPLFLVLIMVEISDLIFAVDSIPAIFAITREPFIVYTSNVFAILGLRSMYFLLAGLIQKFHYLKIGLAVILIFVGVKMVIVSWYQIPIILSLIVIISTLIIAALASYIRDKRLVK